jgi:hypothetical protein
MTGFSSTGSRARTGSSALHFRDDRERGLALVVVQDPDRHDIAGFSVAHDNRPAIGAKGCPSQAG